MAAANISTARIIRAINFFATHGFQVIDVPMLVSNQATFHTCPLHIEVKKHKDLYYVGSAEQSFIQLHLDGKVKGGKYMAMTPCHRIETREDDLHYEVFLKLELIHIGPQHGERSLSVVVGDWLATESIKYHLEFTWDGVDIMVNDVEVGSYGARKMPDGTPYYYGTGVAEPRMSYAVSKDSK